MNQVVILKLQEAGYHRIAYLAKHNSDSYFLCLLFAFFHGWMLLCSIVVVPNFLVVPFTVCEIERK